MRLADQLRGRKRRGGDGWVGAIQDEHHLGDPFALRLGAVIGRDDQPGPRRAIIDQVAQLRSEPTS